VTLPVVDPVASHAVAAALGVLLLLAGWAKLRDLDSFRDILANYELLAPPLVGPMASVLALAECAAGALLLPGATRPIGAALAAAVWLVVTAAVALALARGRGGIACGCGAAQQDVPLGTGLVVRNLVLLALTALAAAPIAAREVVWLDFAAVGAAVLFILGAVTLTNTLLAQHSRLHALRNAP
jgi:uncharacterized membrane protein YphA (DoxX/SURF4 family)